MAVQGRGRFLFNMLKNEKGIMYPAAILLLFFILAIVLVYSTSYLTQFSIIHSLENVHVRATINILNR